MWRYVLVLVITVPAFGQDADMTFSQAYAQYQSHAQAGNLDEALPYAKLAYELGEKTYGPDHKNTAGLTYNYGTTLLETGHYGEASKILEMAYRRYEKTYGKKSPELIDPLMMQGHASAKPDQRPRLRFYDRAIRLAEAKGDLALLAALSYDAGVRLTEQAKSLDGHKYLKKAYDIYTAQLGSDNTQTIGVAFFLGKVEMGRLNNDVAKELFLQVIDGLPPEHRLVLTSHGLLVQLYMQDGDADGIVKHCKAVSHLPKWKQMCGPHAQTATPEKAPEKVTRVGQPRTVFGPPELGKRRQDQLVTAADFKVFHAFRFTDRQPESGITFRHRSVEDTARTYKAVHYDHGNGIAVADVDSDGRVDILFVTQAGGNQLWRNTGGGKFENITAKAGVALPDRICVAASFADIDNDGDADLYITAVRAGNRLFENVGGGAFRDITEASGTGHKGHSSGAVFFDYDRDGLLDLFLTNVGQYTSEKLRQASNDGVDYAFYDGYGDAFAGHLRPERFEQSILYRNEGGNRFIDVSEQTGLQDMGWAGDASAGDIDGDGWTDLYVLNMQGDDGYYQNQEGKRFVDMGREVFPQTSWGAMGIKIFDWNNDGLMDIFITDMHSDMGENIGVEREKAKSEISAAANVVRGGFGTGGESDEDDPLSHETSIYGNSFFEQESSGVYKEISDRIGAENYWPWGLSTGDINADGFQDVFIASSMNFPFRYGVNSVLLNENGAMFRDAEFILGVEPRRDRLSAVRWFTLDCDDEKDAEFWACSDRRGLVEIWSARGTRASVIFDLDDDGDLDIVTNEFNTEPMVLMNNLTSVSARTRYLNVSLKGTTSNRSGIGARVELTTDTGSYVQVMDGKSGYLSQSSMPLYFGLGDAGKIEEIRVLWPSGKEQVISGPGKMNTMLEIEEP